MLIVRIWTRRQGIVILIDFWGVMMLRRWEEEGIFNSNKASPNKVPLFKI
jgi:hypothetical protein